MADQRPPQREIDALIALLAAAFTLSAEVIRSLALLIYSARIQAYQGVYQAIARTVGASLPADWAPSDLVLTAQRDAALAAAQSVANTLAQDMQADATRLVNNWVATHPATSLTDAQHALTIQMQSSARQRAQWKSAQIGQYEPAKAQASATQDAVSDLRDGTLTDDEGVALDLTDYVIVVLPADSSGDMACAEYAGNTYPLTEDYILDLWPAHPNCPHQGLIVPASEA